MLVLPLQMLAKSGYHVTCIEKDDKKRDALNMAWFHFTKLA